MLNPLTSVENWWQGLGSGAQPAAPAAHPAPAPAAPAAAPLLPPPVIAGGGGQAPAAAPAAGGRPQMMDSVDPKATQQAMDKQVQQLEQIQAQIQQAGAEPPAPVVPPPKLMSLPPAPPEAKYQNPAEVFGGVGGMIMLLGSALTKAPMQASLGYYTGMMKGFHEGDVEKIKLAHDQWTEKMESVEKQNKSMLDEFNAINKSQESSVRAKQAQLNTLFHQYQIPEAIIRANKESFDTGEKYVNDMNKAHEKMFKDTYSAAQEKAYNGYIQMATQDLTNISRQKTNILRNHMNMPPTEGDKDYAAWQSLLSQEKQVEDQREKYMEKRQKYRDSAAGVTDAEMKEGIDGDAAAPAEAADSQAEAPPMPGAKKAPDGDWYVETEPGKFAKVE